MEKIIDVKPGQIVILVEENNKKRKLVHKWY